jgi:peptidoglycan/LPS O-acetylase OafA/YrhL
MISFEAPCTAIKESSGRTYYPGLDGLRGVAIMLIAGYHIFDFLPFFEYGWLGVDLFFVLSGFLITDILLKTKEMKGYLRNFYMKRILRIFPIYYLCLSVFIILLPAIREVPYDSGYYREHQLSFWFYLVNWLFIFKHPEETFLLNHLWSLALEEQFYFIWPWLILIIRRSSKLLWIVFALMFFVIASRVGIWCLYEGKVNESLYKFSRVDGLFVGSALAVYLQNHEKISKRILRNILIILASVNILFLFLKSYVYPVMEYFPLIGYTTFAVIFGLILHAIICSEKRNEINLMHHAALRFLGKISYGFYIYHWPIYVLLYSGITGYIQSHLLSDYLPVQFISACIIMLFTALVSIVSYLVIEKKFLKLKENFY